MDNSEMNTNEYQVTDQTITPQNVGRIKKLKSQNKTEV